MKKIIFLIVIVILLVLSWYFTPIFHGIKKNLCPDEWIVNRMPDMSILLDTDLNNKNSSPENKVYYITDGDKDLKNYNTIWVKFGCGVEPQIVN